MKFSLCILSAVAAIAYAAVDPAVQDEVLQSYSKTNFSRSLDVQFRHQSNQDAYFDSLKTFNNLITPREFPESALPLAVLTPRKSSNYDIAKAVQVAKKNGLRVSARSGGYMSGYSANMAVTDKTTEDFVLFDLSKLRKVTVNPSARTATAEPGATALDVYTETIKYGLTFPGPHTARVTMGGFLLQGGMGIGSRLYGSGVDNVIGFDIITASGRVIYADARSNKDLFYAVRGGGQFFGVITKFYLKLSAIAKTPTLSPAYNASSVPIDQVFAILERPQAESLLSFYGDFDPTAPKPLENKMVFVVDPATNNKQYLFASFSALPSNTSTAVTDAQGEITKWYKSVPTSFATSDPSDYHGLIHGSDASWADNDLSYYAEDVWFPVPLDPKLQEVLIEQWDKVPSALSSMALNT
ncbi:hypothetical protein BGW38_008332, partial [Lunasporangiospora selenospora]